MKVTFTKTGIRRYKVTVERPGKLPAIMDPAPGFHDRLPHDVAHFIVEDELEISGGVFGQLAASGRGNSFDTNDAKQIKKTRRHGAKIASENKADALFSEHAIYAAQSRWEKHDIIPDTKIPAAQIENVIARFEEFAARWSKLPVGSSIDFEWRLRRPIRRKIKK